MYGEYDPMDDYKVGLDQLDRSNCMELRVPIPTFSILLCTKEIGKKDIDSLYFSVALPDGNNSRTNIAASKGWNGITTLRYGSDSDNIAVYLSSTAPLSSLLQYIL